MEQKTNASNKVYVGVTVCMDTQGNMLPQIIHWKDGRSFDIECIGKIDRHYSHNQGGRQDRYCVKIAGKNRYLYFEYGTAPDNFYRWYVVGKG